MTRKFNALRVEEVSLKDQLGLSHAEESKTCQEIAGFRTRLMAEEAKGNLGKKVAGVHHCVYRGN